MANAAAKKAAAAKKEASKIYGPLLVVTNLLYVVLLLRRAAASAAEASSSGSQWSSWSKWNAFGTIVTWLEQAYSYTGIRENAANHATATAKTKSKDLAGGSSLDLLAVTLVVQFGSVLHSTRWFWVTIGGVPMAGAYSLYKAVYGNNGNGNGAVAAASGATRDNDETKNDPTAAKRQRRAEKRRQKWG